MADQLRVRHIEIAIQQLNQFNPENKSVGHFLNESAKVLQDFDDGTFLMETLSGCIEYKPLLDVVVNAFYIRDGKHCLLSERNLYVVVCYLATFRLEELGLQEFSRIVKTVDAVKICKFLRFFFSVINLHTWIKDEWSKIYDSVHVIKNWIEPLLRWQPDVQQLIDQLADPMAKYATTVSKISEHKEFHLTVPGPRAILIPELIYPQEKTKPAILQREESLYEKSIRSIQNLMSGLKDEPTPHFKVPETTYKPPRLKQCLQEIKLKNRRKAEELLLEANVNQFTCAATKLERKNSAINEIAKYEERFQAQKIKGKIDNTPIKLNAAAILREGVLYQRKIEQELSRIEHLLQGARDPSEFLERQKQMREKDLDHQQTEAECRRLQGKLSYEEAILARQNRVQENRRKAEQQREEKVEMRHQSAERQLQEKKEKKKMVQQVVDGRKNVTQARVKLQKCKHQIVQDVSEESQELLRQALEEEEETLKKRCELIQQIREIEYVPFLKNKFIDLTQTPNHGVLGEMSVVELRERLALLRAAQKRREEEKRDLIIHEKHTKEQLLLGKLEQISTFREAFGRAAALKQEEKKMKFQFGEGLLNDQRVLDLQKKIVEKSMERKIQTENLKNASPKYNEESKSSWKSKKKSLQDDHWKKLEESRQQQFKMLQQGFMAREVARKMNVLEAGRTGTAACILRS